jgi:hypothetical protein
MTLARITLDSGRDIELTELKISSTYGGLLEGYPNARMNDALIARLAKRRSLPAHVISPRRTYPHPELDKRLAFGPMELLPAVYCQASFRSDRINEELDPVLHRSWLMVAWFQEDLSSLVTEFVTTVVSSLAWEELAEDSEL